MFFLLISTTQSFKSKWIEWSDIEALSQFCKISKSEFCEFSSKSENVLGMNVWHRIKALFAAGQLCYTTNFSTKTQVFTKLRAGKRKNPRNYESHTIEISKEKSKPCFQNFCLWERFLPIPSRQIPVGSCAQEFSFPLGALDSKSKLHSGLKSNPKNRLKDFSELQGTLLWFGTGRIIPLRLLQLLKHLWCLKEIWWALKTQSINQDG